MSDSASNESNFNDSELEDIMSEIEDLEKDILSDVDSLDDISEALDLSEGLDDLDDAASEESEEVNNVLNEDLSEIDAVLDEEFGELEEEVIPEYVEEEKPTELELKSIIESEEEPVMEDVVEEPVMEEVVEEPVMEDVVVPISNNSKNSPVTLEANGIMNFNINLMIGGKSAKISVNDNSELMVSMEGIDLKISDSSCNVEMDGGVSFNLPISTKKIAA